MAGGRCCRLLFVIILNFISFCVFPICMGNHTILFFFLFRLFFIFIRLVWIRFYRKHTINDNYNRYLYLENLLAFAFPQPKKTFVLCYSNRLSSFVYASYRLCALPVFWLIILISRFDLYIWKFCNSQNRFNTRPQIFFITTTSPSIFMR